jgi:hypothetical protein
MPKICYEDCNFRADSLTLIAQANKIIASYQADGYDLTLRQLYYQLVASDVIPNTVSSYNRLGAMISKARRAGLIDWSAIVDRVRNLEVRSHWRDVVHAATSIGEQFHIDMWKGQENYVEVWFEKDALSGIFERAANPLDMPFFACRGYTSDSEMWGAAQRFRRYRSRECYVLHFGDHDPSGIDMTRDITDRLGLFGAAHVDVKRIALNMPQIRQYDPPPNPAKELDPRFSFYQAEYGDESWELDALNPRVLGALVRRETMKLVDVDTWNERLAERRRGRALMLLVAKHWNTITGNVEERYADELQEKLEELEAEDDDAGELLDASADLDDEDNNDDDDAE